MRSYAILRGQRKRPTGIEHEKFFRERFFGKCLSWSAFQMFLMHVFKKTIVNRVKK